MNSLDDLVRDTLAERAQDVYGLALRAPAPAPRRARRWAAVGAVGVVTAGLLVGVAVFVPWRATTTRDATPATLTVPPRPPAGMRWVSYHGITLTVPASWQVGRGSCSYPATDAVVVQTAQLFSCPRHAPSPTPADTTQVILSILEGQPVDGEELTVAGRPAYRSTTIDDTSATTPRTFDDVWLPEVSVIISMTPGPEASALLATLRYTPVDANGCTATLAADPAPITLPAGRLDPGDPVTGVVCEYDPALPDHDLVGSRPLSTSDLSELTAETGRATPSSDPPDPDVVIGADICVFRLVLADGRTEVISTAPAGADIAITDGVHRAVIPWDRAALPTAY